MTISAHCLSLQTTYKHFDKHLLYGLPKLIQKYIFKFACNVTGLTYNDQIWSGASICLNLYSRHQEWNSEPWQDLPLVSLMAFHWPMPSEL